MTALKGVRVVTGHAEGLTMAAGRVEGVTLSGAEQEGEHLGADFVVDCTGKSTRIDTWLTAAGYDAPPQRKVNVGLGYTSPVLRPGSRRAPRWRSSHHLPHR